MNDYYGRELSIGDLVLCLPTSQNDFHYSDDRLSLLIGKKEVFRLYRKKYSVCSFSNEVLIKMSPINTDKLLEKYTQLKNAYDEYMQQEIKSNQMVSNLEPGDIVVRNNKSEQKYVFIGYGDLIIKYNNRTESIDTGYLYIALNIFGQSFGIKMTPKNIEGYEFSFSSVFSNIYDKGSDYWDYRVDKSKLILSKSPIMIKEIKGKLKLSTLNAKYIYKQTKYQNIEYIEFKNKT